MTERSGQFVQPLPFGATVAGNGEVLFRFWAPAARNVQLEIAGQPPVPMMLENPHEIGDGSAGIYRLQIRCQPGTQYRFCFESRQVGQLAVPDPYSRAQHQDVHGFSVVVDPAAFVWQHNDWHGRPWRETVIYEVHPGLAGGFAALTERLPALAATGITALELMPVADFPGAHNWGYDGVLLFAPDAAYGSPEQLKTLIDTAHGLGIMVYLDVVYNHFGPDGNYISTYAPEFFSVGADNSWGSSVDFMQARVQEFYFQNVLYWLREYRFDGLRFDAVQAIGQQGWFGEMIRQVRQELAADDVHRHVHLSVEHDNNAAGLLRGADGCDAQWNDDMHHVLHVLLTGETFNYYQDYADHPARHLARALEQGFVFQGEKSSYRGGAVRGEPSADLAPSHFVSFLQNHDQIGNRAFGRRLITLCPREAFLAAQAMLLLMPQIPMLFMGEEQDETAPFLYFTDFSDKDLVKAVRDGRRREFAGEPSFADEARLADIPDPNAHATFDACRIQWQDQDHPAIVRIQKQLALRARHIAPFLDYAHSTGAEAIGPGAVRASWQLGNGALLTIHVNLHPDSVPAAASDAHLGSDLVTVLCDTGADTENGSVQHSLAKGRLPGYACLITIGNGKIS